MSIKITKPQYNKALNIVANYQLQLKQKGIKTCNEFYFLWYCQFGQEHHRCIKAKSIESAINKFIIILPKTISSLDYEVKNGDKFIDISNNEKLKYLIN